MKPSQEFARYLTISIEAELWGVVVRAGGRIINEPGIAYPPIGHPEDHAFSWERGRVLGGGQVVFITAGEGEFEDQARKGGAQRVVAGEVIWVAPGRWHRYRPAVSTGWTELWVELGGAVPAALMAKGVLPEECRVLRPARPEAVGAAMGALCTALADRTVELAPAELAALGVRLLGLLVERAPQEGARLEQAVRRAERMLAERLAESPSMPAMARELGVGYAGFRRAFLRRTGMAPRQYLLRLRLERAQRLVGAGAFTLAAIAEQLGFSSAFHLSAAFKKRFGRSPAAWRAGTGVKD